MIQLDLSYLETISGGDQSFIHEMLKMFLTTTFPEIEALKRHATNGSWESLGASAHKMKAPIQMLGVGVVTDLILELEQMGKTKVALDSAEEKVKLLESYIKELESEINKILKV